MRKLKAVLLTALSCAAVGCMAPTTLEMTSADMRDFMCDYSAQTTGVLYGSTGINTYTAEQAATAGIPAGYENEVLEIIRPNNQVSCGILLDFSEEQVPVVLLENLQFRVYLESNAANAGKYPEVRIPDPTQKDAWIHQPGVATATDTWTTVTVNYNESKFAKIAKDGMLDRFELAVRSNAFIDVYVDSIGYTVKANEGVAPVITCDDTYAMELGEALNLGATAYDAQEKRNVAVSYAWDDGVALNANGTPAQVGEYNLTLTAEDFYGNLATKTVKVSVMEEDNEAPVINVNFDTVKTTVGTKPMLNVTATDNSGSVTVTKAWSQDALDMRGRLTEGAHTWTIQAEDVFGNTAEKVITFIVTEDEPQYGYVTNEENAVAKYPVTFDGEDIGLQVSYGNRIPESKIPNEPTMEAEEGYKYVFLGWYNGDELWNFETDVVTGTLDLVSRFEKVEIPAEDDSSDFACDYTAQKADGHYVAYGATEVNTYTAEEAAAAGIPAGYENEVLEIIRPNDQGSCGILLEFFNAKIPVTLLENLQFRVYLESNTANTGKYPEVRIPDPTRPNEWIHQPGVATATDTWTTVTIPYHEDNFAKISKDGMLDKFELAFRSNAFIKIYVDSITYTLKANDGVAPAITSGEAYAVELGEVLTLAATAYDVQEKRNVAVSYAWDDGVELNANGTPTAVGTYNLTLTAKDFYGNLATKIVKVSIIEADNEVPVINVNFDTVKTTVGTKPMLDVTATDNSGSVTLSKTWSQGALDMRGRLVEGTHTWTIQAEDPFGNVAKKVITFIVTEEEPQYGYVTNEENAVMKYTVTFDGENPVTVPYGFTVDKPADPVKETTEAASYTFVGWYFGDEEWDFTNAVTQDMNLTAKWSETKRVYRVYFDDEYTGLKVAYGELIPADKIPSAPTKSGGDGYKYVFLGWYNGDELWNFETSVVTGEVHLEPRFEKVEILPEDSSDNTQDSSTVEDGDSDTASDSDITSDSVNDSASDTAQPGSDNALKGCFGMVGGVAGGLTALGAAAVVLLKKKED